MNYKKYTEIYCISIYKDGVVLMQKNKQIDQWNRAEGPEGNLPKYSQLILIKEQRQFIEYDVIYGLYYTEAYYFYAQFLGTFFFISINRC